jgi:hypothetical protein
MKFIRNTLLGLYVNLFLIILLIVNLLNGLTKNNMSNLMQRMLIAVVVVSGVSNAIFAIKNVINTCRLYKSGDYNSLRKHMKMLKLGTIPYFILNFILYFLLFLLFFAASRGLIIFTPIPLLLLLPIFFTYLTVLFTSCYGIGFIAIINKENNTKSGNLIVHVLLQLCFVLDVVSTIILLTKYKVKPRN